MLEISTTSVSSPPSALSHSFAVTESFHLQMDTLLSSASLLPPANPRSFSKLNHSPTHPPLLETHTLANTAAYSQQAPRPMRRSRSNTIRSECTRRESRLPSKEKESRLPMMERDESRLRRGNQTRRLLSSSLPSKQYRGIVGK